LETGRLRNSSALMFGFQVRDCGFLEEEEEEMDSIPIDSKSLLESSKDFVLKAAFIFFSRAARNPSSFRERFSSWRKPPSFENMVTT